MSEMSTGKKVGMILLATLFIVVGIIIIIFGIGQIF